MTVREQADGHFGWCPHCRNHDGYVNAGRSHWFMCNEHKTMWPGGANLFSSWKAETEEEQKRIWNEIGLDGYEEVKPVYPEAEPSADEIVAAVHRIVANDDVPF